MGNARSSATSSGEYNDIWWTNGSVSSLQTNMFEPTTTISIEREQRRKELEEDFEKFKQELARKHERRKQLISEKRKEMVDLREELFKEKEENAKMRTLLENHNRSMVKEERCVKCVDYSKTLNSLQQENEDLKNELEKTKLILREKELIVDKNKELRISLAEMQKELQSVNTQIIDFEKERIDYQEHAAALKDVIRVTKEMLKVRENQITELRKKISTIEELLASKEVSILSDDLRQEYERQLQNIKDLRILYQERQRVDSREKENLKAQIEELKKSLEENHKKTEELQERINELESDNSQKYEKVINLESNLGLSKAECKELQAEMSVINQLFSQILISFNNEQDVDLDNLIKTLEENHDLLTNIAINDDNNEASALPKVLLDLVNQVNENKKEIADSSVEQKETLGTISEEEDAQLPALHQLNSPEEIVENLPKVWRVLIELLSHQSAPSNEIAEKKTNEHDNHCYKSVETPTGLRKVLSVSKTFIRLKSLILEKKSLEKEMNRLKHLNTHLEGRLQDQEKRLVLVSSELSKTWNVVGVMQKQHHQLHTQEKILRYELAQKRKLLTELKEELEYCRQKWLQAKEQNSSTEEQWKQLRTEFASRKQHLIDDISNSVESGYSDEKSSSDDDIPDSDVEKMEDAEQEIEKERDDENEEEDQLQADDKSQCSILEVVQTEVDQIVNVLDTDSPVEIQEDEGANLVEINTDEIRADQIDNVITDQIEVDIPSTSTETVPKNPVQAAEEFVARREARMKRLEEQCSQLCYSVAKTSLRGMVLSNKLNNLHETYGGSSQDSAEVEGTTQTENDNTESTDSDKSHEEETKEGDDQS